MIHSQSLIPAHAQRLALALLAFTPASFAQECKGQVPPLFITDITLETVFKARDFGVDSSYNQSDGPLSDLHAFYDSNHAQATLALPFPSCITASENDYLYVGDAGEDIILALEDLNDDNDCYDNVSGFPEHAVYFDGSALGNYGGNTLGIKMQAPTGIATKLLTVVWVANENVDSTGRDSILRLEDLDGDLSANGVGEAVEYYTPALGNPALNHSRPSAVAIGSNDNVYYVENGSGISKGIYQLADTNNNGSIEDNSSEVLPFFLPTNADLISEGVSSPVTMDLTSLKAFLHEKHKEGGKKKHGEEWFLTDLANDVIWVMEDVDGNGTIDYASGEAHVYWQATSTLPSAVRDLALDECQQLFAVQPEAPSDRIHKLVDLNGDGTILDGSGEIDDAYDDLIAPVDMETPYAIGGDFHLHEEVGDAFCPGTDLTCLVCNNSGGVNEGCSNSTGSGALLVGEGTASVSLDDLSFHCSNLPNNQAALLFVGTTALNGGNGVTFGRGLRCVGGAVRRLQLLIAQNFEAEFGPGLAPVGGWNAGDTRYFQVWYRDPQDTTACNPSAEFFNLSNGVQVFFTL